MDEKETQMNEIFTVLIVVILGLFGINVMKSKKIKKQKEEIKTSDKIIEQKKEELKTINDTHKRIEKIKETPKPEVKASPKAGDSTSRIERLNKLHES